MSSVVVKSIDKARVRRAMDDYAGRLLSGWPEIEEIVVFGSFEEDTYAPGSDIDVFLVLSASSKPVRDRVPDYLPRSFPVGVDLFPFTGEEMSSLEPSPVVDAVRRSRWRYRRADSHPYDSAGTVLSG